MVKVKELEKFKARCLELAPDFSRTPEEITQQVMNELKLDSWEGATEGLNRLPRRRSKREDRKDNRTDRQGF